MTAKKTRLSNRNVSRKGHDSDQPTDYSSCRMGSLSSVDSVISKLKSTWHSRMTPETASPLSSSIAYSEVSEGDPPCTTLPADSGKQANQESRAHCIRHLRSLQLNQIERRFLRKPKQYLKHHGVEHWGQEMMLAMFHRQRLLLKLPQTSSKQ